MFIDEAKIKITSGKGGDGIVHFRREKFIPFGGPDGGDGGKGGDVIFEVIPTLNTLSNFQNKTEFKADDGHKGGGNNRTGRSAKDLIIHVPRGTVIYDDLTGEVLGDLIEPGDQLRVGKGGRGGKGNSRFASSKNQAPRVAERGEPGEERFLRIELKLIADVGLVGVPNAGKSTFLAAVSKARPKIAPYPFTTLEPNLGVAELDEGVTLVLADIPGLIEGAHLGVGLGHTFLRHIQRTRVLIHLVDGMAEEPLVDFSQINSELAIFDPNLAKKIQLVAFNKMDMPEAQERWPAFEKALKKRGYSAMAISGLTGLNVRQLLFKAHQALEEEKTRVVEEVAVEETPVYRVDKDDRDFTISREGGNWRVSGAAIERAAAMTYWEFDQSVNRFQKLLHTLGIEKALRQAGVQPGDTVLISEHELEWQD